MCGLAGVFNFRTGRPVGAAALDRMGEVLAHRGPDASGVHLDQAIGLVHRRLSILDLSPQGRQPMYAADGRYVMVFNGEIYNYLELRHDLEREGHRFRTNTDSEVLLAWFAREGEASLARMRGMFAIAIWDSHEHELWLARDRVGIKPLYYAETADGLVFGSEIKALFEYPGVECDVDPTRVDSFMTFGYVPGASTIFAGVQRLLPGHTLRVTRSGLHHHQYWDVHYAPDETRSEADTADALRDLLTDALREHLRSDVPLGVFLSGGLDSSAVLGLLAANGITGLKSFTVSYGGGPGYDESGFAHLVARKFGAEHHVLYVDPQTFRDFIPGYVWHMDEPVTEGAALSLYFVARELKKQVTVALSGEGADELFAGYQIYRSMLWLDRYRSLPAPLRRHLIDPLLSRSSSARVQKYLEMSRRPLADRYLGVSVHEPWRRAALYAPDMRATLANDGDEFVRACYRHTSGHDALTQMLYLDLKTWLPDDLLIKADKMTMANSVELRVPFLDHRLVEFAATVPSSMKIRHGDPKWILKRAMAGTVPQEVLQRPKLGFPTPLQTMFRGSLAPYLQDVLLSTRSRGRGYFEPRVVKTLLDEHRSGVRDHHRVLWQLAVLEEWHRCFIDARRPASAGAA